MKIELHSIQNFAPSCLNRDDTNTPKSCTFGGSRRARISSQCLKRAMRLHLGEQGLAVGLRTRLLAAPPREGEAERDARRRLPRKLADLGYDINEASVRALRVLGPAFGIDNDGERTKVGLYLSDSEVDALAEAIALDWDLLAEDATGEREGTKGRGTSKAKRVEAEHVRAALEAINGRVSAADIALFGRMMAENANMNVDAACQVAHALSTHAVEVEMDFFTAVDDLQPKADTGAGMMGIVEFNSACFYRYAVIDREQLVANLNGDAALADRAILGFVQATVEALPTGRQNSSAAQNPPDYLQVVVTDGLPRSLANAFAQPVKPTEPLVEKSINKLLCYQQRLDSCYGPAGESQSVSTLDDQGQTDLSGLLDWLEGKLKGGV